jgi:hypothetical protein
MKRGRILLGIVVLVGIVALLGTAQFGYTAQKEQKPGAAAPAKEEPGAVPGKAGPLLKCAGWKIKSLKADKKCYEVHPCQEKEFTFLITAELEASPSSLPSGGIAIDAFYKTCQYESGTLPLLDLTTAPTGTWIPWGSANVRVTRDGSHRIKLDFSEYHVSCKCDGTSPVVITLTVHSLCGGRETGKDSKTLTVPPCPCKCAVWDIVSMTAVPNCYNVPGPGEPDFHFSFTVDLQATSLPPCDLVIEASSKTCTYESGTMPPINLTGVSGWVTWGGTRMEVRRPSSRHIQLYFPEYFVSGKCDGRTPVTIRLTAHSMCGGREISRDTEPHLTVPPCP